MTQTRGSAMLPGMDQRAAKTSEGLQRLGAVLAKKHATPAGDQKRIADARNAIRFEFDAAPDSALFGEDVAAVVLDVSTAVLGLWRMGGKGPNFVRVGKAAKYRKADLLRFVAEHLRDQTDEA